MGSAEATGYRVTRVYPGTEAAAAGLAVGDVVVGLDGEPLAPRGVEDSGLLARRVRRLPIGGEAALTVLRDGSQRVVRVTLERTRLGPDEAARHRDPDFELQAREVTFFDRDDHRWDDEVAGVLVEQIEPAGWAGLGGVRPGDLILRFGGRPVADLPSFESALEAAVEARAERVEVVVLRGARTHFLYLEPEWSPLPEGGGEEEEGGDA
jgi:serine protease Do